MVERTTFESAGAENLLDAAAAAAMPLLLYPPIFMAFRSVNTPAYLQNSQNICLSLYFLDNKDDKLSDQMPLCLSKYFSFVPRRNVDGCTA